MAFCLSHFMLLSPQAEKDCHFVLVFLVLVSSLKKPTKQTTFFAHSVVCCRVTQGLVSSCQVKLQGVVFPEEN